MFSVQNEKGFPVMLEQPVGFGRKSSVAGVGPGTTLLGKKSIVQVKVKLSQEVFPDAAAFLFVPLSVLKWGSGIWNWRSGGLGRGERLNGCH